MENLGIDSSICDLGATTKFTLKTGSILAGASFTGLTGFDAVSHHGALELQTGHQVGLISHLKLMYTKN
ncbi:hypothetical protein EV200_101398 [Pedobacter psychrotolerans]|uniref:Uncharacterized protein n=1 Tax=Pedobacter psychrotolerans TaxID=1843235 RepID=A0A4R2HLE6_9SPHI|nr:hypothetical protein [Pedobacter psychrotolerans]TCO30957.1 hypothetical protein EV200_101398 [Pedobacter psychrotolerans]GGE43278.1 hypothetical protein GCM10011413_06540 [Pedobacter psychrotolerans]